MTNRDEKIINRMFFVPYVKGGRDKSGFDCWGLIVVLYKELYNIDLQPYAEIKLDSMSKLEQTSRQILEQIESEFPFVLTSEPRFGDIIMFNVNNQPLHTGFVLDHKNMLHTSNESGVTMESYEDTKWQKRIAGFWRHKLLHS